MKKITSILFLFITFSIYSQDLIAVQNGGTPIFYEDLSEAIQGAVAGDTIYIPGRSYTVSDTIRKPLHLVGVGHNPNFTDATNRTVISSAGIRLPQIVLDNNSGSGSISGVNFANNYYSEDDDANVKIIGSVNGYQISRSYLPNGVRTYTGDISNLLVKQSIIGESGVNNTSSGNFSNNIFISRRINLNNCVIKNNLFIFKEDYYKTLIPRNCLIENNIFRPNSVYIGDNNIFRNNLNGGYNGTTGGGSQGSQNLFDNADLLTIFVNLKGYQQIYPYQYTADLHLLDGSPYLTAGRNGDQIGIYGGPFPWKEGSIPFNPHIITKQIAPSTDSSGNLQINIEVQAQGN